MSPKGTLSHRIKLAGFDVSLKLAIPGLRIILRKPFAKLSQLLKREFPDLLLNGGDSGHTNLLEKG